MTPHPLQPVMEYAFSIQIELNLPATRITPNATGQDRVAVYAASGTITGPLLRGKVVPMSGGDWAQERPGNVIDFDARYMLELEDGTPVYLQNRGFRWASAEVLAAQRRNEDVPFDQYYMRVSPKFEVAAGPHDWLAKHVFVGVAEKVPRGNIIHYFVVR